MVALLLLCRTLPSPLAEDQLLADRQDKAWQLVFSEEFDGDKLDRGRWTTCYWWGQDGCTNLSNNELQWYLPDNVVVGDGALKLRALKQIVKGLDGRMFDYTSGLITTGIYHGERPRPARFDFQYGLVEVRAKVPSGKGLWPAIWLLPSTHESKPEIDIMEVLGDRTDQLETHMHYVDRNGQTQDIGGPLEVGDLAAGWNVYGLHWSPDEIVWLLNGKQVRRIDDASIIPKEKMYLLMNLAVGGDWPKAPSKNTKFPAEFLIDYVRVWKAAP
jgi:beta-glucanase (GH16 family)